MLCFKSSRKKSMMLMRKLVIAGDYSTGNICILAASCTSVTSISCTCTVTGSKVLKMSILYVLTAYLKDTLDKDGIQELISRLSKDRDGKILVEDVKLAGQKEDDDTAESNR